MNCLLVFVCLVICLVVLKLYNILVIFNQESKKKSLSLSNVAGAYFILISGLVVSIIVGVIEFIYTKAKPDQPLSEVSIFDSIESYCSRKHAPMVCDQVIFLELLR